MIEIREDDLAGAAARALLTIHLTGMHANSPPGHVFALGLSGLQSLDVTVWAAWRGDDLLAIAALKQLNADAGEVKSMRTHPEHLRKGAAAALLEHIITVARLCGLTRLSLETGRGPAFEAALALYRKRGFVNGEAFADYQPNDLASSRIWRCDAESARGYCGKRGRSTILESNFASLGSFQSP